MQIFASVGVNRRYRIDALINFWKKPVFHSSSMYVCSPGIIRFKFCHTVTTTAGVFCGWQSRRLSRLIQAG